LITLVFSDFPSWLCATIIISLFLYYQHYVSIVGISTEKLRCLSHPNYFYINWFRNLDMKQQMEAKTRAHSNIALIKYWGKRDRKLNLPAVGSVSLTLDALYTETSVKFGPDHTRDTIILDGKEASPRVQKRTSHFLDIIRKITDTNQRAFIRSSNNFPTAAGLASSASGFAALTHASLTALGATVTPREMSGIARQGSGSAARSIFGGFVEMHKGSKPDGADSVAVQLYAENHLDIRLLIVVISEEKKATGSTMGMIETEQTSPFYPAWVNTADTDIQEMKSALAAKDFARIGVLSEHSCLKMHATALAARPGILYWNKGTISVMHAVRDIRKAGTPVYFTIDAGPQVKVLCLPEYVEQVIDELNTIPEVRRIITSAPGPGVHLIQEPEL